MYEPIFDCAYCGGPCGLGDACPQNGADDPCMGCNQPAPTCRCGDCDRCHSPACDGTCTEGDALDEITDQQHREYDSLEDVCGPRCDGCDEYAENCSCGEEYARQLEDAFWDDADEASDACPF